MDPSNYPRTILKSPTGDITLTWIRTDDFQNYQPFFQVYGIVFNDKGEVLLIQEEELYFQYRYVCLLDRLLAQTPDPDTGITNPRMFVSVDEAIEHAKWGKTGAAMFRDAIELWQEQK